MRRTEITLFLTIRLIEKCSLKKEKRWIKIFEALQIKRRAEKGEKEQKKSLQLRQFGNERINDLITEHVPV